MIHSYFTSTYNSSPMLVFNHLHNRFVHPQDNCFTGCLACIIPSSLPLTYFSKRQNLQQFLVRGVHRRRPLPPASRNMPTCLSGQFVCGFRLATGRAALQGFPQNRSPGIKGDVWKGTMGQKWQKGTAESIDTWRG